jgi:MFS family permease
LPDNYFAGSPGCNKLEKEILITRANQLDLTIKMTAVIRNIKTWSLVPVIAASSVGTLIEWYDFYIFGTLATIISTQFFPKENATFAFLATLATFAAGLVVRPFGALFFGRLGDLIGRKYTFMVTLVLMGGSTFAIGLIPNYETVGFAAPITILVLRILQGLAIGGEYGGAATFVAEHSPENKRGFWTSWIQTSSGIAFVFSIGVILLTKSFMQAAAWESWGWRIPFLVSALLVVISVYIRRNMSESPLYARAKAEGKTSANPLKESFGNKANLKVVLLALFGLTIGVGVISWGSIFYAQSFLIRTMSVDYDQSNSIVVTGTVLALPFCVFFGWLSDKVGRKNLLLLSMLLGIIVFRPAFQQMYQVTNLQKKTENKAALHVVVTNQLLQGTESLTTTTTEHFYTDGTVLREIRKETTSSGNVLTSDRSKTIMINGSDKWMLILMVFVLATIAVLSYGPLAAYLVEMFPLKIRYSSLSLPYHIGFGIFGGMAPLIATYLIQKANDAHKTDYYLAGLTYPIVVMIVSLIIGLFYLRENNLQTSLMMSTFSSKINKLKRGLGIVWIALGLVTTYFGVFHLGLPNIMSGKQDDLIFGLIMMLIITPVASIGLIMFGKYALRGEYDNTVIPGISPIENMVVLN